MPLLFPLLLILPLADGSFPYAFEATHLDFCGWLLSCRIGHHFALGRAICSCPMLPRPSPSLQARRPEIRPAASLRLPCLRWPPEGTSILICNGSLRVVADFQAMLKDSSSYSTRKFIGGAPSSSPPSTSTVFVSSVRDVLMVPTFQPPSASSKRYMICCPMSRSANELLNSRAETSHTGASTTVVLPRLHFRVPKLSANVATDDSAAASPRPSIPGAV